MARKWIDCRDFPDDTGCTLYLSGEEDDVVRAAAEHAASAHGKDDTPEFREQLRSMLQEERAMAHA
jgi:predicted small metal-binding protein